MPLDKYFRVAEIVTMRDSWDNGKGFSVALTCSQSYAGIVEQYANLSASYQQNYGHNRSLTINQKRTSEFTKFNLEQIRRFKILL